MKILALINNNTFIESVTMNYTNEWIDRIEITSNMFILRLGGWNYD